MEDIKSSPHRVNRNRNLDEITCKKMKIEEKKRMRFRRDGEDRDSGESGESGERGGAGDEGDRDSGEIGEGGGAGDGGGGNLEKAVKGEIRMALMADSGKATSTVSTPFEASAVSPVNDIISIGSLSIASFFVAVISWLPIEQDAGGNRVPTIIFDGHPYVFQAFVILIMFGFSTSLAAVVSYKGRKLARVLRSCSVVCLSCAAAVLLSAICKDLSSGN
ncbi:OLC1v1035052C1 [Oldenlandia corymbosa var. corymbosa]|uniref:OLC1v1035052C1 n=1 Tax=Oldenlandia corymbosa var. corymbosa TaxID=529605 RepID=A0AAV1CTC0_OLDCO|nr:OLC1v1035052C1 [Oldenlandia corymbosa var. corymbosa]